MSHCKYHPKKKANYRCPRCSADYCVDCSDETHSFRDSNAEHRCFICEGELESLVSAVEIEPFWRRLAEIYKYPTSTSPLTVIVLLAFLSAMLPSVWFIQLIPTAAILLYCFASLRETAMGKLVAPEFEKCLEGSLASVFYVFVLIVIGVVNSALAYANMGDVIGSFVAIFFVSTLPAAIMLVAISGEFLPALNVARLSSVVRAIGIPYFVMLMFLMIMISSVALLKSYFIQENPSGLSILIQSLIGNYYLVVEFHILGYIVYQNHDALGFSIKQQRKRQGVRTDDQRLNAKLDLLIKAGDYTAAKGIVRRTLVGGKASLWQWDRALRLMCAGRSIKELKEFWPQYLREVEKTESAEKLADAYMMAKKKLPDLIIKDHTLRVQLAQALHDLGRHKYVVNMLKGFHTESSNIQQIEQALELQSSSFSKIPGLEKNARFYQQLVDLRKGSSST